MVSWMTPTLPGIHGKINVFSFERDSMNRAGVKDSGSPTPPFLVIASNDINEELNSGTYNATGLPLMRHSSHRPCSANRRPPYVLA